MSFTITEFEHIYKSNVTRCMQLAFSMLQNEDEARDVVQGAFVKLWESDIDIVNPQAFVMRAVRNACLDRMRGLDARNRLHQELLLRDETDDDIDLRHQAVMDVADRILTPRQLQVVSKVYGEGMSYRDAAKSLDVSVSMVNKSIVGAIKSLRSYFNQTKR